MRWPIAASKKTCVPRCKPACNQHPGQPTCVFSQSTQYQEAMSMANRSTATMLSRESGSGVQAFPLLPHDETHLL